MAKKKQSLRTKRLVRRQKQVEKEVRDRGESILNEYVAVRKSKISGRGVFARTNIKSGTYIIEYTGEKVGKREAERRSDLAGGAVYLFELNKRVDIDGSIGGNGAHLINHGCNPNAYSELDDNRMIIVADRRIKAGEEITYDYNFDADEYEDYPCRCGYQKCRGYIVGSEDWAKLQKRNKHRLKR